MKLTCFAKPQPYELAFWIFASMVLFLGSTDSLGQTINYQGRLTDELGAPVNKDITVKVSLYDSATGGKELYSEDIGTVTVSSGLYSFEFGKNGFSVVPHKETLAGADGETTVFAKTAKHLPIDSSLVITHGEEYWSLAKQSNPAALIGTIGEGGVVTCVFLQGFGEVGELIYLEYDYLQEGIRGALKNYSSTHIQLEIDGVTLENRERLTSVPYAVVAGQGKKIRKEVIMGFEPSSLSNQNNAYKWIVPADIEDTLIIHLWGYVTRPQYKFADGGFNIALKKYSNETGELVSTDVVYNLNVRETYDSDPGFNFDTIRESFDIYEKIEGNGMDFTYVVRVVTSNRNLSNGETTSGSVGNYIAEYR